MLWVDKYRPKGLKNLSYHEAITDRLARLASNPSNMPHLLIYGPSGAGKKTRVMALLRELFGPGAERLKLDRRTFKTPTNRNVDVNMISSIYHIELCPGDAGMDDRFVVQDVIKEMAQSKSLMASGGIIGGGGAEKAAADTSKAKHEARIQFKVVLLVEVDRLSRQAQAALRRTMEKYASTCRLILLCNNPSKVIDPVRSRCLGIRIPAPSNDDICTALTLVARKQHLTLPEELALRIAKASNRNLRQALLMLETAYVQHGRRLEANSDLQNTDWELYIRQMAQEITQEQSPQKLIATRKRLYELLINCIPASVILKTLVRELCKDLDDTLSPQVFQWGAFYEHRIALNSSGKDIFHLEAFVAKYMAIYKRYLNEMFG